MQPRIFDLESPPFADDAAGLSTEANLGSFANPTNFQIALDSRVSDYYVIDSTDFSVTTPNYYTVTFHRVGTVPNGQVVRFVAFVTCDTDETDVQDEPPSEADYHLSGAPEGTALFLDP